MGWCFSRGRRRLPKALRRHKIRDQASSQRRHNQRQQLPRQRATAPKPRRKKKTTSGCSASATSAGATTPGSNPGPSSAGTHDTKLRRHEKLPPSENHRAAGWNIRTGHSVGRRRRQWAGFSGTRQCQSVIGNHRSESEENCRTSTQFDRARHRSPNPAIHGSVESRRRRRRYGTRSHAGLESQTLSEDLVNPQK